MKIVGLLLAAGSATRFGSDKLRHALPHGVPIALQALRHLKAVVPDVWVVVRPGGESLFEGEKVVVCANADGASSAVGTYAAPSATAPPTPRLRTNRRRDACGVGDGVSSMARMASPWCSSTSSTSR